MKNNSKNGGFNCKLNMKARFLGVFFIGCFICFCYMLKIPRNTSAYIPKPIVEVNKSKQVNSNIKQGKGKVHCIAKLSDNEDIKSIAKEVVSINRGRKNVTWNDVKLQYCLDDDLGIKMLCNAEWEYQEGDNAILLLVSEEPTVTITITKLGEDFRYLEQLNRDFLYSLGEYKDGFKTESVKIADRKAIKVKAFSSQYPDIRILDYYFVHDSSLYGLLFSINPKEEWDNYKFLFQKLANSFEFIERSAFGNKFNKYNYVKEK